MPETIRTRAEIPAKYKWNAASVFPAEADWETAADSLLTQLNEVKQMEGSVGKSASNLAEALDGSSALLENVGKVLTYAFNAQAVDNLDANASRMMGKAQSIVGQVFAGIGFLQPEILAMDPDLLANGVRDEPRLKVYDHFFDDLIRQQAHVRSAEVEEILGLVQEPLGGLYTTMSLLTDSEMKYPDARTAEGKELEVTQGTLETILASPDREARRTAWEGFPGYAPGVPEFTCQQPAEFDQSQRVQPACAEISHDAGSLLVRKQHSASSLP